MDGRGNSADGLLMYPNFLIADCHLAKIVNNMIIDMDAL